MWATVRPSLSHADRAGRSVRGLDVGDPEDVVRIRDRLVEQKVGATVDKQGEKLELLRHRTERRSVPARGNPHEQIDIFGELQPAHFLDVRVRAGGLVGFENLDLSLSQKPTLRVDLVRGQQVALVHRLTEDRRCAGEESHVADPVRLVRNRALRFVLSMGDTGYTDPGCRGTESRRSRHTELSKKITSRGSA
jgi:hypothetical protein